jgi:hypothetical protein
MDNIFVDFEKKHGSVDLTKVFISTICQILAAKGIVTAEELRAVGKNEIKRFEEINPDI